MKKRLLFCSMIGVLSGCYRTVDINPNPSSLAAEVSGVYRTNFYLDPSCVAIPANQMPYAELKAESDSNVTVMYTKFYPVKSTQFIEHITVGRQPEGIYFRTVDSAIGTLKTDRIFTNNGMEKQGQLLRLTIQLDSAVTLNFTGIR